MSAQTASQTSFRSRTIYRWRAAKSAACPGLKRLHSSRDGRLAPREGQAGSIVRLFGQADSELFDKRRCGLDGHVETAQVIGLFVAKRAPLIGDLVHDDGPLVGAG